ncbi:beta strand repeat-containing protein [Mesobacterium pallidum]|uniref:beta strand repeat-containing protein n=1 Tax=Mesobacterium pallidum TaxID=2872037 RepID=UPI001EE2D8C2|nr:calcium-binding protein [Mesobacterium pallidum]
MTTYTFHGFYYSFDDQNVANDFYEADIHLAVAPGVSTVSYSYNLPDDAPGPNPSSFDLDNANDVYSLLFEYYRSYSPDYRYAVMMEVRWNDGGTIRTSYVLKIDIDLDDVGEYAVVLGGAALPQMNNAADFDAFDNSIVSAVDAPVGSGFGPGEVIDLDALPNVSVSENDRIWGTDGNDSFFGGAGNDTIETLAGDDYINPGDNEDYDSVRPGSGNDTVDFADLSVGYVDLHHWDLDAGITANINGNANTGVIDKGVNGTTTLLDVENPILAGWDIGGLGVLGTSHADTFNITSADGGWMIVAGRDGADSYNIGASDGGLRLDFRYAPGGLRADFSTGQIFDDGWGNAETIVGAENVTEFRGTDNDDSIRGTDADERMILRQGNDTADGAGGYDTLRYDRSGVDAVTVDLLAGTVSGTWNGTAFSHQVSNFEAVRGSREGDDSLTGTHDANELEGRGGDDTLVGLAGNDSLYGGDDDNTLFGNAGDDYLVVYEGNSYLDGGADYDDGAVRDDSSAAQRITFGSTITVSGLSGTGAGADVLYTTQMVNIERVVSQFGGDLIVQGDGNRNVLKLEWGLDFLDFDGAGGTDQVQLHQIQRLDGGQGFSRAEFFTAYEMTGTAENVSIRSIDSGETVAVMTNVEEVRFTDGTFTFDELIGAGGGGDGATAGDDLLAGTAGDDLIDGLAGNDTIRGDTGFDTLIGGAGDDDLYGENGFDSLDGGDGQDYLSGGNGNDTINAGTGAASSQTGGDYIEPGAGADVIIGHAELFTVYNDGIDLSWRNVTGTGGITVTVGADGTGTAVSAVGGVVNDSFTYAHLFYGTGAGDTFIGSGNANWEGWGGFAGNDTMDGGAGYDELLYHQEAQDGGAGAINVNFATGTATDGFGNTDSFSNMEAVRGTAQADSFTGSAALGYISYRGLGGADTITGSAAWDRADYSNDASNGGMGGIIADLAAGTIVDGFGATDTVSLIDHVRGTDAADVINGSDADERFDGRGGNDTLGGMLGHDELNGDDGDDQLYGGAGDDTLSGGAGADYLVGGDGRDRLRGDAGDDTIDASGGAADGQGYGDIVQAGTGTNTVMGHAAAWSQNAGFGLDMIFTDITGTGIALTVGAQGAGTATSRSGSSVATSFTWADHFEGTHQNDSMQGSDASEGWVGEAGDDTIHGGGGWDILRYHLEDGGTQGVDVNLLTGQATDSFGDSDSFTGIEGATGTAMNDALTGNAVDNWLGGLEGDDTLRGYGGNDVLEGDEGNDDLDGGAGNDTLYDGTGNDIVRGGEGDDLFIASTGQDSFFGNGGNDTLRVTLDAYTGPDFVVEIDLAAGLVRGLDTGTLAPLPNGIDALASIENAEFLNSGLSARLIGDAGGNRLESADGHDTLNGGDGFDTLLAGTGDDLLIGGAQGDFASGGDGNDSLYGNDGFDTLSGEIGADLIAGQKGNDLIYGGDGHDTLYGNIGDDTIFGGNGQDLVYLGEGNDTFEDNTQEAPLNNDTVWGEDGDDIILGGNGFDAFYGGTGADYIRGGKGFDSLYGGDQSDTLYGNDGNDLVYGGRGADYAVLGNGADTWMDDAQTTFGDDQVFGGGGWDTIHSLGGNDTLTGGAGNDSFVFGDAMGDVFLTDFTSGEDDLSFTAALWGGPLTQAELDARASLAGSDLVLTLDTGATVTLDGVSSTAGLLGDIVLV